MANRYPLIIDGNQIKEIPDGDDLYFRNNSITGVSNITALGSVEAAEFLVQGKKLQSRNFLDLDDTPETYQGKEKFILRVTEDGSGLEFAEFQNLGEINFDEINAGTIRGDLIGSVFANDSSLIVDGSTGTIPYSVLSGAPTNLSEFNNDLTSLTIDQITLQDGLVNGNVKGSIFADDSTILVDSVNGNITGRIIGPIFDNTNTVLLLNTEDASAYTNIFSRDGNNTLLVDAVNGLIPWEVINGAPNFDSITESLTVEFLTVERLTVDTVVISDDLVEGNLLGNVTGNLIGDLYASDAITKVLETGDGITSAIFTGNVNGNVNGNLNGTIRSQNNSIVLEPGTDGTDASFVGNVIGDVIGSIFADDSTLLVDAVNGTIPWDVISGTPVLDVEIAGGVTVPVDANFDVTVEDSSTGTSTFRITDLGIVQVPNTITSFGANTDLELVSNGTGSLSFTDGQNGIFLNGNTQALNIASTGSVTIQGAAGSTLNIGTGTSGTVTIGSGSNTIDFPDGTNIDFTGTTITGNTANITETDPIFTASPAAGITTQNITDWNDAANYIETDTLDSVTTRGNTTTNSITVGGLSTGSLTITSTGSSNIQSSNDIILEATNRTSIEGTPFRVAQLTATEINAISAPQDGDIIYNTTIDKFQVRENGGWNDLTTSGSLEVANYSFIDFSGAGTATIGTGSLIQDDLPADILINITVSFLNAIEITISGMMYYGGATGISDRTIDIERSINGGPYSVISTIIGSPQGPTNITFVDVHGAANSDILTYRFRNTGTSGLIIDYSKANQIIVREV